MPELWVIPSHLKEARLLGAAIRADKFRDGILARIPMGRWAASEEAVEPVCFLLSDAASYITGQHIAVDGGFHISV